jgi:hypothetical protein
MNDLFPDTVNGHPEFIEQNGVRYIREDLAHPVVKKADYSGFDDFWESIPKGKKNGSKPNAKKAWGKLSMDDKINSHSRVQAFYSLTKEERIGAENMHVSTYLNSRAWEEDVVIKKKVVAAVDPDESLRMEAQAIIEKKGWVHTIRQSRIEMMLAKRFITPQQCREAGL